MRDILKIACLFVLRMCNVSCWEPVPLNITVATPTPSEIKVVSTSPNSTSVTLIWNAAVLPEGSTVSYDILFDKNSSPPRFKVAENLAQTSYMHKGVDGTNFWNVVTKANIPSIGLIEELGMGGTVRAYFPEFKTMLSDQLSGTNVTLSWTMEATTDGSMAVYNVYINDQRGRGFLPIATNIEQTTVEAKNLILGHLYLWYVSAIGSDGLSIKKSDEKILL